jgi:hypothetical protein
VESVGSAGSAVSDLGTRGWSCRVTLAAELGLDLGIEGRMPPKAASTALLIP